MNRFLFFLLCSAFLSAVPVYATSNYQYGPDEYVAVAEGLSPDGKYAITAHGGGDYGYDHFHVYLTDVSTGKPIGPLEEITQNLDTGAGAIAAKWSADSTHVTIVYRVSRHSPLQAVHYRIGNRRAFPINGRVDATDEETAYWGTECSQSKPSPKVFGTPVAQKTYDVQ